MQSNIIAFGADPIYVGCLNKEYATAIFHRNSIKIFWTISHFAEHCHNLRAKILFSFFVNLNLCSGQCLFETVAVIGLQYEIEGLQVKRSHGMLVVGSNKYH